MKNRPIYSIDSVDHALHLAEILQQEGALRVADAADRLGVARSTAHRLLAMLVYRDFAEQTADRRYTAGPVLRRLTLPATVASVRRAALPQLRALTKLTQETSHVLVISGDQARFVASAECDQMLRVGDREGRVLPAHLTSGGRAVLATFTDADIEALYGAPDSPVSDLPRLQRDLRQIRRQGFAVNDQVTEAGLIAIGCAIPANFHSAAAVSLAMPKARYRRERLQAWTSQISITADRIGRALYATPAAAGSSS